MDIVCFFVTFEESICIQRQKEEQNQHYVVCIFRIFSMAFPFRIFSMAFPFSLLYFFQGKKKKSLNLMEITAIPFEGLRHPALWLDVLAVLFVLFISV